MNKTTPQIPADFDIVEKTYSLYGKSVKSNYPMPLPEGDASKPDVTFTFEGIVPKYEDRPPNKRGRIWRKEDDGWLLRYYNSLGHMNEFRFLKNGTAITFTQSWPEWRDTLFALMNPVMAAAVTLQGAPVLHSSSLVLNGKSTLVMGISGAGKSSLSAALAANGLSVHSDDIGVIEWNKGDIPLVMSGYSRIKIDTSLEKYLNVPGLSFISITKEIDYAGVPDHTAAQLQKAGQEKWLSAKYFPGGFHAGAAPLNTVLILDERIKEITKPRIKLLRPMKAGMALTEHMYGRDWLNPPGPKTLKVSTRLAESVPVYKINMPDNLDILLDSAAYIKKEILEHS